MGMDLRLGDCLEIMKTIPDNSIDLIVTDPPYLFDSDGGGGAFGSANQAYHNELSELKNGITNEVLAECVRVLKKVNIYVFCNKNQLYQYIDYFKDYNIDLLTWHKTNPIPTCNNKYLSDTEYILFFREKGVKVYGTFQTKRKWYLTPLNTADKKVWKHPTIKPLSIIENLITNSSIGGGIVLDPFMGSGTTGVACQNLGRNFIGIEINEEYYEIAKKRINEQQIRMNI